MRVCTACGAELPALARFCPACGAPAEKTGRGTERKLATVVFADLVGSTELADSRDPEDVRALLDRFYDAMAAEIERAGGTVEKFAGDAVMAAFGVPRAYEDHAERALHASFAMQRRLRELFGGDLALRIGVNTGEVVAGRPREGSSFVTGDAVNVAARLEQAAAPGEILAGERTVAAVRGAFEFDEPRTVGAKGKPAGVTARRLVRALSLMRPRGPAGLHRTFVGRDRELELLQATHRRSAERGEPHLVTIMGDAGIGKTRLVRELWGVLAGESPQPRFRTGRCLPYGQGVAYFPLGEILREELGVLESDAPEDVRHLLGDSEILGLALGLEAPHDVHPRAAREELHAAWVAFVEELAGERPAVVLLEDLHWAEDELLELLERFLRDIRGPLLLVATARPELLDRRPGWGGGRRNASLLWLEPLSGPETERALAELVEAELPEAMRRSIVERAEGNPFFLEELLDALIDRGVLERIEGAWIAREPPPELELPDSVQAVLAARIDLLEPREKAALQAASVIGRIFWTAPVRMLLEGAEPDFALLEERDFIRHRPGSSILGEEEYAIKHALTREVAYASLPRARRARLHAAFAAWIEERAPGRDEHAPFVAHHYAEAVQPEDAGLAWPGEEAEEARLRRKAVTWLRRAAELAVARLEIDEGLALFTRAIELEESDAGRAELWAAVGRAHAHKYDGEAFRTAMETAIRLSTTPEARAETYSELALETASRFGMWARKPKSELVEGWIERALELSAPTSEARAKALIARAFWNPSDWRAAANEAGAIAERLGDPVLRCLARDARSITAFASGEIELGHAMAERLFEFLDEITDPDLRADISCAPISGCVWSGRFGEARRLARLHDEVTAPLTPHHRVHGVAILVELEELLGGWEAIAELEERVRATVAGNPDTPCVRNPRTLLVCGLARTNLGDAGGARKLEEKAEQISMEGYGLVLDTPRIGLALARGDLERVEQLLAEPPVGRGRGWLRGCMALAATATRLDALAALGERTRVEEEAVKLLRPGTYLEPFALRALGRVREDSDLVERAAGRFEAMGLEWHAARTRARG